MDWWALGVLMFEMMAGRSPFDIITDNPDMNTEDYLFQGAWAASRLPRVRVPPSGCAFGSPPPPDPAGKVGLADPTLRDGKTVLGTREQPRCGGLVPRERRPVLI